MNAGAGALVRKPMTDLESPIREHLSLWMRDPAAPHAWMRIVKGGDPANLDDRRVFVEKTPRVHDPRISVVPSGAGEPSSWIGGPKGHADDGDGPDLASRRWADEKAVELGYVLPDMRKEVDNLILDWRSDPSWNLEDAPGFEEHRDELKAVREKIEADQARRRAAERDEAINALMRPALASLPESDPLGGLTRSAAASSGHASHRLLRAVAEMLLPIAERFAALDERIDKAHLDQQDQLDDLRRANLNR